MNRPDNQISALADPGLLARVVDCIELTYTSMPDGKDAAPHVRAASAVCGVGRHLAILQDDANWLALVDIHSGAVEAIPLPLGLGEKRLFSDRRGNKHHKLDLEACTVIDAADGGHTLLGFGSGSLAARERVLRAVWPSTQATPDEIVVEQVEASALYATLRAQTAFAGSELNVEGAVLLGDQTVRVFQRGNGAPSAELRPVDASCDLPLQQLLDYLDGRAEAPTPNNIVQYDLGDLDGVRLTFTDATRLGERVLFLAAAEDSPDVVRDGPVTGAVVGIFDQRCGARWAPLTDSAGERMGVKAEGIWVGQPSSKQAYVVCDPDDIDQPARLLTVELEGDW